MSLPRYERYESSEIEWLGDVPGHWHARRFKQVFREREERSESGEEMLLSVSAYTGVSPRSELVDDGDHISRADSLEGYKICKPNDLVMNIMLAWNRGLGFSIYHGIVSPAYCVFELIDDSSPRFLDYLVRSNEYIGYFKTYSAGVIDSRLRLYPDAFGALRCYLPTREEQEAIVGFLDYETAKIDALVEEQKRLIELLKEKRQAVITQAVTKGLNPNTPMKPSGVEWLGDVPAHWRVTKAGRYLQILSGFAFPSASFSLDPSDTRLLRGINVGVGEVKWEEVVYWPRSQDDGLDRFLLNVGDIVVGMDRPWISEGVRVARLTENDIPCLLLQRVVSITPNNQLHPDFLYLLFLSNDFASYFTPDMTGVSVPHLSPDQIWNYPIPLPPIEEQTDIIRDILVQTTRLDHLVESALTSIDLLQERRSTLISAAVTGKIDVRGIAAKQEAA